MLTETDFNDYLQEESMSPCKEMFISKKEMSLRLQTCEILTSRRQSTNNVGFNNLTRERYVRVSGTKYKLGQLFVSMLHIQKEKMLKVTISQYGNLHLNTHKKDDLSRGQLSLHVSLRQQSTLVSKQKFALTQNKALRTFKYNYTACFQSITEENFQKSSLRFKLKCKTSVFRRAYTIGQKDLKLRDMYSETETPLDILFTSSN